MSANSLYPNQGITGMAQQFNQMTIPDNTQSTLEGYGNPNANYKRY